MIKKKVWLLGLCLVIVILFLFSTNITLAKEKLGIYTTLDEPLARAVLAAFEEDTGIEVEWVRLSGGECVARLIAEKENPQISMWYGGVGLDHIVAKEKGLTTPYESPNAVNIPDKFKGGPQPELAKKLYDWALTERAAEIYASVFVCPFLDVELKEGAMPISKVKTIVQDDVWAGANKDRLVAKWTSEVMGQ